MTNINVTMWKQLFEKYINIEKEAIDNITKISNIKNNLKILLGNQKKDDVLFYKSIIDNSHFYLSSSFTIRKNKLLSDLNNILSNNNNFTIINELNKHNFNCIIKDYIKLVDKINIEKDSNAMIKWVKNNKIESMVEFENNMNETLKFHIKIFNYFNNFIKLETKLYCETKRHIEKENNYNYTKDKFEYIKEYNEIDKSIYVKEYNDDISSNDDTISYIDMIDKFEYTKEYNEFDKSIYIKEYNQNMS